MKKIYLLGVMLIGALVYLSGGRALAQESWTRTYGPYITTHWSQLEPFNGECPTIDGKRVPAGCVTISSAQILNYYKKCSNLNPKGRHSIFNVVESPYFSNTAFVNGLFEFDYDFSYNPDFDKINSDDSEMAKFIMAIALSESCFFDEIGSMSSYLSQYGAFENYFGYDCDLLENGGDKLYGFIISQLENKRPVVLSDRYRNHSYIIDGYRESAAKKEFHANMGWGGDEDGWYSIDMFEPSAIAALSFYPSDGSRIKMKPAPKYLYIKGVDNNVSLKKEMEETPNTGLFTSNIFRLGPGTYTYYYEFADKSIIAPSVKPEKPLELGNSIFVVKGKFKAEPSQFTVADNGEFVFYYDFSMGQMSIQATGFSYESFGESEWELVSNLGIFQMKYDGENKCYYADIASEPGSFSCRIYNKTTGQYVGQSYYGLGSVVDVQCEFAEKFRRVHFATTWDLSEDKFLFSLSDKVNYIGRQVDVSKVYFRVSAYDYKELAIDVTGLDTEVGRISSQVALSSMTLTRLDNNVSMTFSYSDSYSIPVLDGRYLISMADEGGKAYAPIIIGGPVISTGNPVVYIVGYIDGETVLEVDKSCVFNISLPLGTELKGIWAENFETANSTFNYGVFFCDPSTPVEEIELPQAKIWSYDNNVVIENAIGAVSITDLNGRLISTIKNPESHHEVQLKSGVYIVKTATSSAKVVVR